MALARVLSRAQTGLRAELVTVEVHLAAGLPGGSAQVFLDYCGGGAGACGGGWFCGGATMTGTG